MGARASSRIVAKPMEKVIAHGEGCTMSWQGSGTAGSTWPASFRELEWNAKLLACYMFPPIVE